MNTPAFLPELIQFTPSAFHPPPPHAMRAASGQSHTAYIPVSAPPPPSHPNMKLPPAPQSLSSSSSTIAKPTPIPASAAASSGIVRPTPKSASSSQGVGATTMKQSSCSVSSKGVVMSSGSKGEVPSTSMNLVTYGFQPHPHMMPYGLLNTAAVAVTGSPSHGQLSKMLLSGGSQQPPQHLSHAHHPSPPPPSNGRSAKSEVTGKATASQGKCFLLYGLALLYTIAYLRQFQ